MSDDRPDGDPTERLLDTHVQSLMEHFETVHVFVTRQLPGGHTQAGDHGRGNWYARYGQVKEWLTQQEARTAIDAARDADDAIDLEPDPDDDSDLED